MRDDRTGRWGSPVRNPQLRHDGGRTEAGPDVDHWPGMHARDYGEHGRVLEAGVQYFGRPGPGRSGQPARSEGTQRAQDRSPGRLVAGPSAAARHADTEFHSAASATRVARSDAAQTKADPERQCREEPGG